MFQPPRCPYRRCPRHLDPKPSAFWHHGSYQPKCRSQPVPRFRCTSCWRTFSRQSFRMDFSDHRPELNPRLFELLASGIGLRQSARLLKLTLGSCEKKFRKLARHLRRLNLNLAFELPVGSTLQFDEFESFENTRVGAPLSIPFLIERESRFLVWAETARLRQRSARGRRRKPLGEAAQKRLRSRRDGSRAGIERTLRRGRDLTRSHARVTLETDKKLSYVPIAQELFGKERLVHRRTSSRLARTQTNPLFAVNQAEAMARDLLGRLRRQSWLASKKRRFLDLALALYASWRNFVRRRFNHDKRSAAEYLGFVPRRLTAPELCSWRQEWGKHSIHPLALGSESIAEWRARRSRSA